LKLRIGVLAAVILGWGLTAGSAPLWHRDIAVESGKDGSGRHAASLVFFLPEMTSGYNLTDAQGKERGVKELSAQGSRHEILFNAAPNEKLTLNYFRDIVTVKTEEPVSGLLHEMAGYNGGPVVSVDDFRFRWNHASPQGIRLEKRVYSAWNPLGSNGNSLHRFHGFIVISKDGEYWFYTASTDASFVLIDDRPVAAWPGRHWVGEGLYGKFGGLVQLKQGIHRFEYLQANCNPDVCYSIAAWKRPGENKFQVMPETAFTPVWSTKSGRLQNSANGECEEFSWRVTDALDIDGLRGYRLEFDAFPVFPVPQWMIAGQHMTGGKVIWFAFNEVPFAVSMDTADGGAMSQQVAIRRNYDGGVMDPGREKKFLAELLHFEQQNGLSKDGYAFLCAALVRLQMTKEAQEFYRRNGEKVDQIDGDVWFNFFRELILSERLETEKYEEALTELQRFGAAAKLLPAQAEAALEQAKIQLDDLNRPEVALAVFKTIDAGVLPPKDQVIYHQLAADLAVYGDGLEAAKKQYAALDATAGKLNERQKMQLGGVMINIRNCLILKKYADALEYLDQLAGQMPAIRLQPEWNLWYSQALLGSGKKRRAAAGLERLLHLDPSPEMAAEAALLLARIHRDGKQKVQAVSWLKRAIKEAPQSKAAATAIRLLDEMTEEK